jgi:hypothetical protein
MGSLQGCCHWYTEEIYVLCEGAAKFSVKKLAKNLQPISCFEQLSDYLTICTSNFGNFYRKNQQASKIVQIHNITKKPAKILCRVCTIFDASSLKRTQFKPNKTENSFIH